MMALTLLRAYWRPLAVVTLLLLVWLHGDHHGTKQERQRWELQSAKSAQAARKKEQELADFSGLLALNMQEFKDEKLAQRDRIIADLRSGRLSFSPGCGVPEAAANPGAAAQAEDPGQPRLVAEAITDRFAACDEAINERNEAVELLRAERR